MEATLGWDMEAVWKRYGSVTKAILKRCGNDMEAICGGYGREYSRDMDGDVQAAWGRYGGDMDAMGEIYEGDIEAICIGR